MTAPVAQSAGADAGWRIRFYMPSKWTMDGLPTPDDDRVALVAVPAEAVAVLRFSGDRGADAVATRTEWLAHVLRATGFEATGTPTAWFSIRRGRCRSCAGTRSRFRSTRTDQTPNSRIPTQRPSTDTSNVAAYRAQPDAAELDESGRQPFAMNDAAPQQVRQRTQVGQVRSDVHPDQHGQHRGGPAPATSGSSTRTAGRLLTTLDSTAATTAMPSSASSVVPVGQHVAHRVVEAVLHHRRRPPRRGTARTPGTARSARRAIPVDACCVRRPRLRTPSTTAPASAAQAGDSPSSDVTANPASVSAEHDEHEHRHVGRLAAARRGSARPSDRARRTNAAARIRPRSRAAMAAP